MNRTHKRGQYHQDARPPNELPTTSDSTTQHTVSTNIRARVEGTWAPSRAPALLLVAKFGRSTGSKSNLPLVPSRRETTLQEARPQKILPIHPSSILLPRCACISLFSRARRRVPVVTDSSPPIPSHPIILLYYLYGPCPNASETRQTTTRIFKFPLCFSCPPAAAAPARLPSFPFLSHET